ncbi:MAG: PPOX class F420-dependent oxidoreductase [Acidimicrobiales bacterium]
MKEAGKILVNLSERIKLTKSPTVPNDFRDLLDVHVAILATNGQDGVPQVTAVWFIHDNATDEIKVSLNDTRQKAKNLRADPKATLFILDPANPYRSLEIRANTELAADSDFSFAHVVATKYGQDPHEFDQEGDTRSIVTLRPTTIHGTITG